MAVIKSLGQTAEEAADKAKTYAKTTEAYVKLQVFKYLGVLLTFLVKGLVLGGLLLTGILFFSVSLMVVLSEWLGSLALACGILGVIFAIAAAIAYYNRKSIDRRILMNLSQKLKL
jgi:hypothetical protein